MDNPDEVIDWIKNQLRENTPLRLMYQKKKADLFLIWAESLEQKIKNKTLDLEVRKISNYLRHELIELDLETAIHHMYHSLPQKYKLYTPNVYYEYEDHSLLNSTKNSSTENHTPEISSNDNIIISEHNIELKRITKQLATIIQNLNELLDSKNIEDNITPNFIVDLQKLVNAISIKSKYVNDGREKICKLDQVLALQLSASCTLNNIYDKLTAQKMIQSNITSKQMGKIISLRIKEAFETLNPTSEIQAVQQGWTGIQCDKCAQFRVERAYNPEHEEFMDHCLMCDTWQKMKMSQTIKILKN